MTAIAKSGAIGALTQALIGPDVQTVQVALGGLAHVLQAGLADDGSCLWWPEFIECGGACRYASINA